MAADILYALAAATLGSSVAILVLIALRAPIRRLFGARLAYAAWLIVPAATGLVFLPQLPAVAGTLVWTFNPMAGPTAPLDRAPIDWRPLILAAWLAGAVVSLAAVALVQQRGIRRLGLVRPAEGGPLRASSPLMGPAVIGLVTSRMILPVDFEQRFSPKEQAVILAHEEAHMAGGDVRINAALVLAKCLFWFNPLVHVAARLVRIDQELACDSTVMARFPGARRTYAEALLKSQIASASLPLGCYWPERSHQRLKERMTMLTQKTPGRRRVLAGAMALVVLGLGTGYAAWAFAPQPPASAPSPGAAPAGMVEAVNAALGLSKDTKLTLHCDSRGAAACTYSANGSPHAPLPAAGVEALAPYLDGTVQAVALTNAVGGRRQARLDRPDPELVRAAVAAGDIRQAYLMGGTPTDVAGALVAAGHPIDGFLTRATDIRWVNEDGAPGIKITFGPGRDDNMMVTPPDLVGVEPPADAERVAAPVAAGPWVTAVGADGNPMLGPGGTLMMGQKVQPPPGPK